MNLSSYCRIAVVTCVALSASVAALSKDDDTAVPATLRPPTGEVLKLKLVGSGVQIYQCQDGTWKFQGPEATLTDATGKVVGKHYAGPTWESLDGSKVVAEVKAHEDSPDAHAIPWLLLSAKSVSGKGVFGEIRSVQRLQTTGGQAPHDGCDTSAVNQIARVPYTANYYFYAAR